MPSSGNPAWNTGDVITATKMNNIETALTDSAAQADLDAHLADTAKHRPAYIQNTEPTDKTVGAVWYNPDTGMFYISDGTDYKPIPPVQVLEEVVTFTETGLTVLHNNTGISNGSLQILNTTFVDDFEDNDIVGWSGTTSNLSVVSSTDLTGNYFGRFTSEGGGATVDSPSLGDTKTYAEFKLRITADTGNVSDFVKVYFYDSADTLIGTLYFKDGSSGTIQWIGNTTETLLKTWSANTIMQILMKWDFENSQVEIIIDGVSQGVFGLYNAVSGWDYIQLHDYAVNGGVTRYIDIDNTSPRTSGYAYVEFPHPSDIKSWDLATFQNTLDGETVTVDVEQSTDGGATWTQAFADIDQNFDISTINPSYQVRFKVNLSRANTANNPSCDYLARRYVR